MTEYNKLINDVNNGKFSPIYLIHGEENYFINNIIENITRNVINETSADFDLKKIFDIGLCRVGMGPRYMVGNLSLKISFH